MIDSNIETTLISKNYKIQIHNIINNLIFPFYIRLLEARDGS